MARRLGNENKEEHGQETHWNSVSASSMKEAKERASGAVKRDWEPRLIEARPEAERWDQTGWQDLKGVLWDLRPTGVPEPEVDVEAQPRAAEAERRE